MHQLDLRSPLSCLLLLSILLGCEPKRIVRPSGIVFETAPKGAVAPWVASRARRAREEGDIPLVYVSAPWCEPCQVFQKAAHEGLLDREFPNLLLLKFDIDSDSERLNQAGYQGAMIPLFVVPQADGTASARKFAGSVKGRAAIQDLVPKLRTLLSPP